MLQDLCDICDFALSRMDPKSRVRGHILVREAQWWGMWLKGIREHWAGTRETP